MTHICLSKLTIIASDNGLSPGQHQAIIWTNDGILLIWPLGTNFSEILIQILSFSFQKMHWKMSSGKWRPFHLGLNVLNQNFSLSCSENLTVFLIHYKLTCPGANFTAKVPKLKFHSSGVTGRPQILHMPHAASYVFLVLSYSDLSNMAELPSFSPPASESTLQYRTSPPRQARMRPKLKAAPVHI